MSGGRRIDVPQLFFRKKEAAVEVVHISCRVQKSRPFSRVAFLFFSTFS